MTHDPDPWLEVGCYGACDMGAMDDLVAWRETHPELPTSPEALVAWVREHGCPDCGSLEVTVVVLYEDEHGETHQIGDVDAL